MTDYNTDFVKKCATDEVYNGELVSPLEFDRWLNAQLADAWDKGRKDGLYDGRAQNPIVFLDRPNPYRKADS